MYLKSDVSALYAYTNPVVDCFLQESSKGEGEALKYGFAAMQGWRVSMVRHYDYIKRGE